MRPMFSISAANIKQDLLASAVVFLVALPLCLGIAIASGAPPAAGLITGIVGGIVAGALAGCPLQVSGPAAGLTVLVYEVVQQHGLEKLGLVVFAAGLLQILAGIARAGQLFRSISPSVIYGMLAGIGVLIFGSQFHVMVDDKPRENGLANLLAIPEAIYKGIMPPDGSSHHLAALLGVGTIAVLVLWTRFAPQKLRWVPGALVAVSAASLAAALFQLPVRYVTLSDGLFSSIRTTNILAGWTPELLVVAITIAFVASAETLLSAAAVDQMHDGARTQYNRELIAQGLGNSVCGFLGVLPMTGVIVRSATNVAAGARTRLSAVLHGIWLLVLVAAVPWLLRMVPTASLAAVLVFTGYKLVNLDNIKRLLRYGGAPVLIYAATLIGIVATDLLTGILIGLGLSILKVIYARTSFAIRTEARPEIGRMDVYLEGAATFLKLPKLADALERIPLEYKTYIHFRDLDYVDDACLEVLANWQHQRTEKGIQVQLEWNEALRLYRDKNPLGRYHRADLRVSSAAH
ncbi:MAG TPA: SulP family inorganic anion transporter [Bryobacteraceae bacterium]|nr:SulP family inorganic anion transporter [Bryobacteraceae bacterium]